MKSMLKMAAAVAACTLLLQPDATAQVTFGASLGPSHYMSSGLEVQSYSGMSVETSNAMTEISSAPLGSSVEYNLVPTGSPLYAVPVTTMVDDNTAFSGLFTITRFDLRGDVIYAVGVLNGTLRSGVGVGLTESGSGMVKSEDLSVSSSMGNEAISGGTNLSSGSSMSISGGTNLSGSSTISSSSSIASMNGGWTGIGTGYGESGPEATVMHLGSTSTISDNTSLSGSVASDDETLLSADLDGSVHTPLLTVDPNNDDTLMAVDFDGSTETPFLRLDRDTDSDIESGLAITGSPERGAAVLSAEFDGSTETPFLTVNEENETPLVRIGTPISMVESEANRIVMTGTGQTVKIPVQVVGSSCESVSLALEGLDVRPATAASKLVPGAVTVTAAASTKGNDERLNEVLCEISSLSIDGSTSMMVGEDRAELVKQLNRLISESR